MSHVPHSREVDKAIGVVSKEIKTALKHLNQQVEIFLARGHYDKAEALVKKAQAINEFQDKIKVLRADWRELRKAGQGDIRQKDNTTPLWEYYHRILQILLSLGGQAKSRDVEREFESNYMDRLKPGDTLPMARGIPRWKKMMRRTKKPMIKEGFIEDTKYWQLTAEGKEVAKSGDPKKG